MKIILIALIIVMTGCATVGNGLQGFSKGMQQNKTKTANCTTNGNYTTCTEN
jgi:uncharacterized protein YceK